MKNSMLAAGPPLLGLILCAAACGDDTTGSGGSGGAPQTGATTTQTGTTGTGIMQCEEPTPKPGATNDVSFQSATAIARDGDGMPISDAPLQLCGTNLCLYATTSGIGQAAFNNDSGMPIDRPLFKPGDSLEFGKIGYLFDPAGPSPLPGYFPRMTDSGSQFAPGESVSAGGVTLAMPAEGGLTIDELTYDEPAKRTFRAGRVAAANVTAATGDPAFAMVYSLGPVDTLFCPPAQVTFENYANLPAGSAVEIWGQEVAISEGFGGYGSWIKLDDGTVSADGATITTDTGLPVLLTVAIRAK